MKWATIALFSVVLALLTSSCSSETSDLPHNPPPEFGSADSQRMAHFRNALRSRSIPFDETTREGIAVLSWRTSDDDAVRTILCNLFPPPPPQDRSVAMGSREHVDALVRAFQAEKIAFEIVEFEGVQYLVWERTDSSRAQQAYRRTFGTQIVFSPNLDMVNDLMKCSRALTE